MKAIWCLLLLIQVLLIALTLMTSDIIIDYMMLSWVSVFYPRYGMYSLFLRLKCHTVDHNYCHMNSYLLPHQTIEGRRPEQGSEVDYWGFISNVV